MRIVGPTRYNLGMRGTDITALGDVAGEGLSVLNDVVHGMHHLDLLDHPEIYGRLRQWPAITAG